VRDVARPPAAAIASLSAMLVSKAPELRGATVLVDSPRLPRDMHWSQATGRESHRREQVRAVDKTGAPAVKDCPHGREIDAGLHTLVRMVRQQGANATARSLLMFPTPPMSYFDAQLNATNCKPHLRILGQALFGDALIRNSSPASSGGVFTRFMVTGFAAYRALEAIGAEVYESYPDLIFRLWCRSQALCSKKNSRSAALASRISVLASLARRIRVSGVRQIRRLDEADAAVLALTTIAARESGMTLVFEHPGEGRFMVPLDEAEASIFSRTALRTS